MREKKISIMWYKPDAFDEDELYAAAQEDAVRKKKKKRRCDEERAFVTRVNWRVETSRRW